MAYILYLICCNMKWIIIIIFLAVQYSAAAFEKTEAGAASFAMGNASVAIPFSLTAIFNNPAALDTESAFYAQLSARNFYGFQGISQFNLVLGFEFLQFPFAISVSRFGNTNYQEIQFSAASAFKVTGDFFVGLGIQSYFLSISGYGADNSLGINLGILYNIDNSLYCGAIITNINQPVIGSNSEELPQCFGLGICYFPQDRLTIAVEIFRDIRFEPDYRLGISYQFEYPIIIRIGLQDILNSYCLGLGVYWGAFIFDYALQMHQILDESHIVSMAIRL